MCVLTVPMPICNRAAITLFAQPVATRSSASTCETGTWMGSIVMRASCLSVVVVSESSVFVPTEHASGVVQADAVAAAKARGHADRALVGLGARPVALQLQQVLQRGHRP